MASKPPLTEDQVFEIIRLYNRRKPLMEIAGHFDRTKDTIRKIVTGESYRAVTSREHKVASECDCLRCVNIHRQDYNLAIADRADCTFRCLVCRDEVVRRAVLVQRSHGLVLCDTCDGRR